MLRKRSRPALKDQMFLHDNQAQNCNLKARKNSSFFTVRRLFVGLSSKVVPDCESARSPTSPLDYKLFSSLSKTFSRSPRSSSVHPKSWECGKVGLGLVDSLRDVNGTISDHLESSDSKGILLVGSQMKVNIPNPTGDGCTDLTNKAASDSNKAEFEIGDFGKLRSCSADGNIHLSSSVSLCRDKYEKSKSSSVNGMNIGNFCGSLPVYINSSQGFMGSLSASDIELSEDYTCIVSHGPNPKTTHIFGDCILESNSIESPDFVNKFCGDSGRSSSWVVKCSDVSPTPGPSHDFLSFCFSCKKKLEEGKDIYIYRGEKAFCSCNCREQEILLEEEMEKPKTELSSSPESSFHGDDIFLEEMTVSA